MIIAITSTGKELDSSLDTRFGRCKYIIIYNTDDSSFSVHDNQLNLNAAQGAGIQTAQNILNKNANIVITGNLGPNAFKVLQAGEVKTFLAGNISVKQAIEDYQNNKLKELNNPNVEGHW